MLSTKKDFLPVSGSAEEMQNGLNREGEEGHNSKEDVDGLTGIYYCQAQPSPSWMA